MANWRGRSGSICGLLIAANIAAWGWAWAAFAAEPVLLATALLAYTFGLRHAFDADHIAAIDNAARKLIEAGEEAGTTGLFFSLGHATVVILASAGIALVSARLSTVFAAWKPIVGILSTGFSALCLFALAIANSAILVSVCRLLARLRRGDQSIDAELTRLLAQRGLLGRLLRRLFRLVSKSWHLYPLGFLFGLGFDTATEIGVLGVSAAQASDGLPLRTIMIFPALFTAGMVLVDTLDAILMGGAYRWAAADPVRKLWYNLAITLFSVLAAMAIGAVELFGLFCGNSATGFFCPAVAGLNDHFEVAGASLVVIGAATWLVSVLIWRARRPAALADASAGL